MKKKFLILFLLLIFLLTSVQASETDETSDIDFGIDLIKNRTGENKAGQYYKNFDKENITLFLDGFWDLEFLGLSSFEFVQGYAKVNSFQGVFKQKANLSLLFLLNKSFYFETLYKDDYKKSFLALGYFGKEGSPIKHIRAGNSNIKFPLNYGYVDTGGGKFISPGIMGAFAGETWNADAVLRYESSEYNSKIYYGSTEIVENKISINAWQRAMHFYIPADNLYGKPVSVFVKDFAGGQWRPLSPDEFSVDPHLKVLSLKKSYPEGVAVNYFDLESNPSGIGDSHLQNVKAYFSASASIPAVNEIVNFMTAHSAMDSYKKRIYGKDYLVLKEKMFSPFEIASRYSVPQNETDPSVVIFDINHQNETSAFTASIETTNNFLSDFQKLKFIQVLDSLNGYDFSRVEQMFPFRKTDSKIYLPDNSDESNLNFQILCKNYLPSPGFVLPDTAIPGSIRVFKNRISISNFTYNESTYTVTINEPILSNDIVEIQWKEGLTYSDSGTVRFAGGAHWKLLAGLDMFFAGSGDWEITKQKYNPIDTYKLSAGIDYKTKNINTGSVFGFQADADRKKKAKAQFYSFKNKSYFSYSFEGSFYSKNEVPIFSNPIFYFEENFIGNKKSLNLHTKTNASLDIWKIKLAGLLSLKNDFLSGNSNFKIIESYGHSVTIPIYYFSASEDFFVNIHDSILRREGKINFEKYVNINYMTAIDYNKDYTSQRMYASISPIIPEANFGVIYTQTDFSINQKYKNIFNPSSYSYDHAWSKSLVDMYSKGEKNAEDRSGGITFLFNYFPKDENKEGIQLSGFNFDAFSKTVFQGKTKKKSIDETGFEISIPFNTGKIFFFPIIKRKITKEKNGTEAEKLESYASDLRSLFTGLGGQYWLFSKPFFYDMFDQKINTQIQSENKDLFFGFFNSYGFSLSRLISGSIKDLYTPIDFGTSVSRLVQSAQSNAGPISIYGIDFSFKYTALNISGKYGYFDWFKFYDQDELNRLYKFGFSFGKNFFKFNLNSVHSLYFFFGSNNKLGFENEFLYKASKIENTKLMTDEWKEKLSIMFSYKGGSSLPRLLIETFSKIPLSDSREERLSVEFSQNKTLPKLNYKFSFRHSQSTKIGAHGEVKIFAELEGSSTKSNSFLLNVNAGISGKVDF
ncbi:MULTISPECIES: hypothetical protein [unclassified Treponema]|uniref:hypothetical protein n=1 Tax=unclassified Treponema TaxID=2638727 RepID=UPI0020A38377|nr:MULTISPECIES: hypothetical protein [unclassified Treponema]UTC66223.1 hypothetical protein E4O06_09440 [Treponema sp. OMZ 789]UTC68952.1 hypothetical protein E4O01_09575 [Treponema sp. OMZ 790]UTC71679.1 hypothetical protein E4O02_09765 [Treponema sp. OMZ 791]